VCGHYCCLFALYIDRGYTPKQFVALFNADIADRQVEKIFLTEFGSLRSAARRSMQLKHLYKVSH